MGSAIQTLPEASTGLEVLRTCHKAHSWVLRSRLDYCMDMCWPSSTGFKAGGAKFAMTWTGWCKSWERTPQGGMEAGRQCLGANWETAWSCERVGLDVAA